MHPTINQGTLFTSRDPGSILQRIPHDLQQYLTTTENLREIYHSSEHERDRRIRLLLRRFTNQIQYGCTNPYCTVPTCLTYRKRTAPGPLRPHTDVTARALAVKCLDQYATHGRDLGRYPSREKSKMNKTSSPNLDGLCWSEPVVPWYSDPTDYFARKKAAASRRPREERRLLDTARSNATVESSTKGARTGRTQTPVVDGLNAPDRPLNITKQHHPAPLLKERSDPFASQQDSANPSPDGTAVQVNGHVPRPKISQTSVSALRHDHASFTQSLFKHSKLQSLDVSSTVPAPMLTSGTIATPTRSLHLEQDHPASLSSESILSPASYPIHSSQPINTFRILPPDVIRWFRDVLKEKSESESGLLAQRRLRSFLNQCLHFVVADPTRLLLSASTWSASGTKTTLSQSAGDDARSQSSLPNFEGVIEAGWMLAQCYPDSNERFQTAPFLMRSLQHCYRLPHYIKQPIDPSATAQKHLKFLPNCDVARLVLLVLNLVVSATVPVSSNLESDKMDHPWLARTSRIQEGIGNSEQFGSVTVPWFTKDNANRDTFALTTFYHYQPDVLPLCESIADIISHRIALDSAANVLRVEPEDTGSVQGILTEIVSLIRADPNHQKPSSPSFHRATQLLDYMQAIIHEKWDRTPIVRRTSPVGGALETLKCLFVRRRDLGLSETWFTMLSISTALDEIEMPFQWLSFRPDPARMHILQFSFLFPPTMVVRYFRSLNLKIMKHSHEKAMAVYANGKNQLLYNPWHVSNLEEVLNSTRPHMARYFVMTISRSNILEDAIGQIWQRERQELSRPLKIILGKDEGEDGLDHGGVQQEFFRLVFAEAFNPKYGMFDSDPITHMTWFKPSSLEPLYKYEALGVLMSLAIFNGVTIPVNLPLAFYRKILGFKIRKIEHIEDGWPELAKSFEQLLSWDDGDVEDVMALTYDFSYDAFGRTVTIDMTKASTRPQRLAGIDTNGKGKGKETRSHHEKVNHADINHKPMSINIPGYDNGSESEGSANDASTLTPVPVTNSNRESFVRSYITYLTHKTIEHQFNSFLRGLHALLSPTALSLFTPSHLKLLFEGQPASQPLLISSWRLHTKYEDFTTDDPIIIWFWEVLEQYMSQTQLRKLLEFVTASNRLPVGGWEGVTFIVQRNGTGDDRLPGSSTCYGRLLLPEYTTKEALRERLIKAVEEGLGFGMI